MQLIAIPFTVFLLALSGLGALRVSLPDTLCEPTLSQVGGLVLEKMTYNDVRAAFGCDGVLKSRDDLGETGEIVLEDYSWRLDTWPYGRFDAHFINGALHGTTVYSLSLALSAHMPN